MQKFVWAGTNTLSQCPKNNQTWKLFFILTNCFFFQEREKCNFQNEIERVQFDKSRLEKQIEHMRTQMKNLRTSEQNTFKIINK